MSGEKQVESRAKEELEGLRGLLLLKGNTALSEGLWRRSP